MQVALLNNRCAKPSVLFTILLYEIRNHDRGEIFVGFALFIDRLF
ncbi:Uncharacterised protein [Vibrio cholerae]|nr:Uncharacterised protein [Vibrio cholerae]